MSISSSCFSGHLGGRALAEPQAAQPEASPAEQQAQECPSRRAGQAQSHAVEDRAEGRQPFVDVPAHQELVSCAALELDQLELIGVDRRLLVRLRRLDAATDVGQRIAQPRANPPHRRRVARAQLERAAIELDGPIKRQRLAGLVGREPIVVAGLRELAGPLEMHAQRFGIRPAGLPPARWPGAGSIRAVSVGSQMVDHRFADPVVVGFHLVERSQTRAPDQMLGSQQRQPGKPRGTQARRPCRRSPAAAAGPRRPAPPAGSRPPPAACLIRRPSTLSRLRLARQCPAFAQLASFLQVFHQLVDEVRTAPRLADDGLGQRHRRWIVLTDQPQRQLASLSECERLEGDFAVIAAGRAVALGAQAAGAGTGLSVAYSLR